MRDFQARASAFRQKDGKKTRRSTPFNGSACGGRHDAALLENRTAS